MKTCPVCGLEMKERNKVLECQNKCDRTTARGPVQREWSAAGYQQIGDGCFVKDTRYKE